MERKREGEGGERERKKERREGGDFPSGPVVKTALPLPLQGVGVRGTMIPHAPR